MEDYEFRDVEARASPEVERVIAAAEVIVVGLNPIASVGPILAVPGMKPC